MYNATVTLLVNSSLTQSMLDRYAPIPYTSTHAHTRRVKASRASAGLRARTEAIPIYYLCTKKFYYTPGDETKLV